MHSLLSPILMAMMIPALGSVWMEPSTGSALVGSSLVVTITFDPNQTTTVTGLDACLDFDPTVFEDPAIQQHFISDTEMTNFSIENEWENHPDSFHYQRLKLPNNTGWAVAAGANPVYSLVFPIKLDAPIGWTTITFTQSFITFTDQNGELLDPGQIGSGSYYISPVVTETPLATSAPTATLTPELFPALSTTGRISLLIMISILLASGRMLRARTRY